ncbi:MAG TPA: YggT family protein [Alphaproteobacteria bacterium]|nr:YggT family protein [Alphaproteobacteria bacterium]
MRPFPSRKGWMVSNCACTRAIFTSGGSADDAKFCQLLNMATEPLIRRLRKYIPVMGGFDFTPMVIIFGIYFLQKALLEYAIYLRMQ